MQPSTRSLLTYLNSAFSLALWSLVCLPTPDSHRPSIFALVYFCCWHVPWPFFCLTNKLPNFERRFLENGHCEGYHVLQEERDLLWQTHSFHFPHYSVLGMFWPLCHLLTSQIFIALMIASAATDNSKNFTCATTEDEKDSMTTSEKISTSYKVSLFSFMKHL